MQRLNCVGETLSGAILLPLLTGQGDFTEYSIFWRFTYYLQEYTDLEEESHAQHFHIR